MILSIIIPYFNADAHIGRLLDSLLDQDLPPSDYEIIVVDDESEEEPRKLMEYVDRHPQIRYCRIAHGGLSAARNAGLSVASGEWLYFCDADDFVQPQVLGGIIAAAEAHDLEVIQGRRYLLAPDDPVPPPHRNFSGLSAVCSGMDYLRELPSYFSWGVWSYLIRHSLLKDLGLTFEEVYVEDRLFFLRLWEKVTRMAYIDVDLYYYVQHKISLSRSEMKKRGGVMIPAWFKYLECLTELMEKPSTPAGAAASLQRLRVQGAAYLLRHVFKHCPVRDTVACIERLTAMGVYPVGEKQSGRLRFLKEWMDRPKVWIFCCRIFHLLPYGIRLRI